MIVSLGSGRSREDRRREQCFFAASEVEVWIRAAPQAISIVEVLLRHRCARAITLLGFLFCVVAVPAAAQTSDSRSLDEVNKELSNPISSIWALQLQENTYWLNRPERNVVNLQFQPVLPLALTDDWNLITRPVFQVMNSSPYVNKSGNLHRVTGFGDTILAMLIFAQSETRRSLATGSRTELHFSHGEQLTPGAEQVAARTRWRIRLPRWQMARRSISAAVVFGGRSRLADGKSNEHPVLLRLPAR